jgi:DMSO/TMAO reductase YedYZ molybdopterin-dependent catalytic subunit
VSDFLTRRKFLIACASASLLAGCDGTHPVSAFLRGMKGWNGQFEQILFSPKRLAPELPSLATTPEDAFPVYFVSNSIPVVPDRWALKVGGMVARPIRLSLAQIQTLRRTEMRVQHHCVEGWSAVASWYGVRLSDLAKVVGLDRQVKYVEFRSFDSNYWSSWDLASALHPQTLLAYGMNDHPLGPEHGAPLRVYSAVKLGYKMVKYLTEVNFLPYQTGGYWENQGYDWFGGV